MSFGWSVGDVIAGIKVVYDVYQAVSDGPINAQRGMPLFFTCLPPVSPLALLRLRLIT